MVIPQWEAERLIAMHKTYSGGGSLRFPPPGGELHIPLVGADRREIFTLDVTRGTIRLTKVAYHTRARQALGLCRLELDGPPHTNPDGAHLAGTHLHRYREGYGLRWAEPLPALFSDRGNLLLTLEHFFQYCAITAGPIIEGGLFT